MSEMSGFLFEVPAALMTQRMYLPLIQRVVMPGGALSLPSEDVQLRELFIKLKAADELVVLTQVRDAQSATLDLHPVGSLAMIADVIQESSGAWMTVFAGVGRVILGPGYMVEAVSFPVMDVQPLLSRCDDRIEARLAISRFRSVSAGLGAHFSQVIEALHRYASFEDDPSLVADRLAGLVGMQDAQWLQAQLNEPDVLARFELINARLLEFMAAIKASAPQGRD